MKTHFILTTLIHKILDQFITVDSEIFARVLFSQNFAYAKFRKNKIKLNILQVNCGDPDQMMRSVVSDLGLHC